MSYTDIGLLNDSVIIRSAVDGGGSAALCRLWPVPTTIENQPYQLDVEIFSEGGTFYVGTPLDPTFQANPPMEALMLQNLSFRYFMLTQTDINVVGDQSYDDYQATLSSEIIATITPTPYTRVSDGSQWIIWTSFSDPSNSSSVTVGSGAFVTVVTTTVTSSVILSTSSYGLTPFLYYDDMERHISSYNAAFSLFISGYGNLYFRYAGLMPIPPEVEAELGDNIQLYPAFTGSAWYATMTVSFTGPGASAPVVYNYNDYVEFPQSLPGQKAMAAYIYNNNIQYVYLGYFINGFYDETTAPPSPESMGYVLTSQTNTTRVWTRGIGEATQTIIIVLSNPYDWQGALNTTYAGHVIIPLSLVTLISSYQSDESDIPTIDGIALNNGGQALGSPPRYNPVTVPGVFDYPGAEGSMLVIAPDGTWSIQTITIPAGSDNYTGPIDEFSNTTPAPYTSAGSVKPSSPGNIIAAVGNFNQPVVNLGSLGIGLSLNA